MIVTYIVHIFSVFLHQFVSRGEANARHRGEVITTRQDAHLSELIQSKVLFKR